MPKFPEPPASERLAAVAPIYRTLPAGTELWRIYFRRTRHPSTWDTFRHFGPVGVRFDHHLAPARTQERGISYLAWGDQAFRTCVAEVFQRTRRIDPFAGEPWLVAFVTSAPLSLLDLTSIWVTRAGASAAIASGPHGRARRWSQAIYAAYPAADGLCYTGCMGNAPALALYERARRAVPPAPSFHLPLSSPDLLDALRWLRDDLGYRLRER